MSVFPLSMSFVVAVIIISVFRWFLYPFLLSIFFLLWVGKVILGYVDNNLFRYRSAFFMFIISEIFAFGTLFYCCLASKVYNECEEHIASFLEGPLVGCALLFGSSFTVTAYHHSLGLRDSRKWLYATLLLGVCFVCLQMYEFHYTECDFIGNYYYSCCFSVVGLHCSHVLVGLYGLWYFSTYETKYMTSLDVVYFNMAAWYWHFVDAIWLFVYGIVYIA